MRASRPILRVGLTGGIASGKSTVAGFLAEMGAFVLDADRIAHEVMAPGGPAHPAVVERFGNRILQGDGGIDRKALAALVFHDPAARRDLNRIVHPEVLAEVDRKIREYASFGHSNVAVLDAALLVESGAFQRFHRLVVTRCSREAQLARLLARGGMTRVEALARIEAQAPQEAKLAVADHVVDTDDTLAETRRQVTALYGALLVDFEQEFGEPGASG